MRLKLIALTLLAAACDESGQKGVKVQPGSANGEPKEEVDESSLGEGDPTPTAANPEDLIPAGASLLDATYDILVKAGGMEICKGDIQMKVSAAIGKTDDTGLFKVPKGKIKCTLVGEIDLVQMVGGFDTGVKPKVTVKNDVIHLDALGTGVYTPPRPFLPSFIAASKESLASLNVSESIRLEDTKAKKQDTGTITVRMLSFNQSHKPPRMTRTFKNVMHFELTNTGFANTDRVSHFLFDKMDFMISLNPVAILHVGFKGKVAEFKEAADNNPELAGGAGGGIIDMVPTDGFMGMIVDGLMKLIDVEMNMDLVSQDGLDAAETTEDEGDGEVIGGKKD